MRIQQLNKQLSNANKQRANLVKELNKKQRDWTKKVKAIEKQLKEVKEKEKLDTSKVRQVSKESPKTKILKNNKSYQKLQQSAANSLLIEDPAEKEAPILQIKVESVLEAEKKSSKSNSYSDQSFDTEGEQNPQQLDCNDVST